MPNSLFCGLCGSKDVENHNEGCPSEMLRRFQELNKGYHNTMSQEIGYRIKKLSTGLYYDPQNYKGTSLGKLYSYKGIVSLMSYNYRFFNHPHEDWEIFEYLVDDEISLINNYQLEDWEIWKKILKRKGVNQNEYID